MVTDYIDPRSGATFPLDQPRWCGTDRAPLLLTPLPGLAREQIDTSTRSLWRYRAAFPFKVDHPITLGEGMTPLIAGTLLGVKVLLKCEWFNPTCSFKDRGASVMLSLLRAQGIEHVLEDSSGNGGAAVAAYAAAGGMAATIMTPTSTSPAKTVQMRAHGATVELIPGTRQDTADAAVARSGPQDQVRRAPEAPNPALSISLSSDAPLPSSTSSDPASPASSGPGAPTPIGSVPISIKASAASSGSHVPGSSGSASASTGESAVWTSASAGSIFYASHNWHPFFLQGTKTLAYELWEDLGFRAPDNIITPCGAGSNVLGCEIGFSELLRAGQIESLPRIFAAQPANCAPIAAAFLAGSDEAVETTISPTIAEGTAIARPIRIREVLGALRETRGGAVTLTEQEIGQATLDLARIGIYVEPTCAQAAAAFAKLLKTGTITAEQTTVLVMTGTGLKATPRIAELLGITL